MTLIPSTRSSLLSCCALFAAAAFAMPATAQTDNLTHIDTASSSIASRFPAGSITDKKVAGEALDAVKLSREEVETASNDEERHCYDRFFVTNCVNKVKESRRLALGTLRTVEVEANAFLRQDRVVERDRELEKNRIEREAKQPQAEKPIRVPQPVDPVEQERQAARIKQGEEEAAKRIADHNARQESLRAKEAADAQKREKNIAAQNRKVQKAEERQREIARRKAEKETQPPKKSPADASKP